MLAKTLRSPLPRQLLRARPQWPRRGRSAAARRRFATASSASAPLRDGAAAAQQGQLAAFTEELDRIAPRFDVSGEQVRVLRSPEEFYETLKVRAASWGARGGRDGRRGEMADSADGVIGEDTDGGEEDLFVDAVCRQDGA